MPLSADTIKRRIDDMSNDILETLIKKIKAFLKFSIQIDETTSISKRAQLLSIVRFVDCDFITDEYLFCKEVPQRTIGQQIFRMTNQFFTTHGIHWSNCISVCVHGVSAMMGADKGFAAWVKRQNLATQITHCCIQREALMIKLLTQELSEMMSACIEIANLIKAKALNSRIFFNNMRRNGIRTAIMAILLFCVLAFTKKSSRKTI